MFRPAKKFYEVGFTLIELLLVLGIIVTLGLLVGPRISHRLERAELQTEADRLQTAMSHLRLRAIQTGRSHLFQYLPQTADYQMKALEPDEVATIDFEGSLSMEDALSSETNLFPGELERELGIDDSDTLGGNRLADWMGADDSMEGISRDGYTSGASELTDPFGGEVQRGRLAAGIVFLRPGEELVEPIAEDSTLQRKSSDMGTGGGEAWIESDAPDAASVLHEEAWSMPIVFFPDGHAQDAYVTVGAPSGHAIRITVVGITGRAQLGPRSRFRSSESHEVTPTDFDPLIELEQEE